MRHFLITYKENKRNGLGIIMHRKISISKPTDDIGLDAKAAVGIFISLCLSSLIPDVNKIFQVAT